MLLRKIESTASKFVDAEVSESTMADTDDEVVENDTADEAPDLLSREFNMTEDDIRTVLMKFKSGQLVEIDEKYKSSSPNSAFEQLQKEVEDLRDENALLVDQQARQLSAKKDSSRGRVVAISADAGSPRSASSVSIMSYSDTQDNDKNSSLPSSARKEVSFGRAGPEGAVAALSAELSKKGPIFADDAAFIREVHEGISLAPNMDPDFEIKRLVVRYKTWSRDFKARLKATQSSLKARNNASHHQAYVNASARPIGDPVNHTSKKSSNIFRSLLSQNSK